MPMDYTALMERLVRDKYEKPEPREDDPTLCIVCQLEPRHPEQEDDTCGSVTCREIWLEEMFGRR